MSSCKVSCPYCGHGNIIDLELYFGELINLFDLCNHCSKEYGFDIERVYKSHSFPTKLSS